MRDPRHRHNFRAVVDDVHHTHVTGPDAPQIFLSFQLLAPSGPWVVGQRQNFPVYAREHRIVQGILFFLG